MHPRSLLSEALAFRGLEALPRKTRIWVRMPNWLGDVVMALPLLRAMRRGRPDAAFTLVCHRAFVPLLEALDLAEHVVALPPRGSWRSWRRIRQWRLAYPSTIILFTNSFRGDLEATLIGAPQRFGIRRPGKPRPLLTHAWKRPGGCDEAHLHQTDLWAQFLAHFGLEEPAVRTPLALPADAGTPAVEGVRVGLICGTENEPAKRWPVARWRTFIESAREAFPRVHFVLFGTRRDQAITAGVARGFPPGAVRDRAGQTSLLEFAHELKRCAVVVCNDTGGMHLANALGVPVLALFGPTNPVRTGPVFEAPRALLQPKGCPPTGGASLEEIAPETVIERLRDLLPVTGDPRAPSPTNPA
jgi:ADP-heptose:LPS heptosyltransferase